MIIFQISVPYFQSSHSRKKPVYSRPTPTPPPHTLYPKKSLSPILFVWEGGGWGLAVCKTCNRPRTDRKALEHPTPETDRG